MTEEQADRLADVSAKIADRLRDLELEFDTKILAAMLTVRGAVLWNLLFRAQSESKSDICDIYGLALGVALEPGPAPQVLTLHDGEKMTKQ